jgi:hypothetical protein
MTDQNTVQTYHLKLSFSQYEKSYLMEHLTQYQKKIQRHLPKQTFTQDPPFMTSDHRLLQFESTQTSLIPAYDSFLLDLPTLFHSKNVKFKFLQCLLPSPPIPDRCNPGHSPCPRHIHRHSFGSKPLATP